MRMDFVSARRSEGLAGGAARDAAAPRDRTVRALNVLVLGAGNVGFTTARALARRGHRLALLDVRRPDYVEAFLAEQPDACWLSADATDPAQVGPALAAAFPGEPLDAVLATVGIQTRRDAVADFAAFAREFHTNVLGNLVPLKLLLPRMTAARRGRIVLLSSTSAHHAARELTAYGPSKWALEVLGGALRSELAPHGISVEVVSPTSLANRHSEHFTTERGFDPDRLAEILARRLEARTPGRRFVPRRYRAVRSVERLAPVALDLAAGLPPGRRRRHRAARVETALVTGASSGLGRELARLYARRLRELWLVARTRQALEDLRAELERDTPCRVHVCELDLADASAVEALARELDGIHLLVNNAGFHVEAELARTPLELARRLYDANFLGAVRLTAALLGRDTPPRKIVNVLSTTALEGRRGLGVYGGSKAALQAFTRSLRRVHGGEIQVLEVVPATFESDLFEKAPRIPTAGDGRATGCDGGAAEVRRAPPAARRLSCVEVARRVQAAEASGRERLYVPVEARMFALLEALAPPLFRRLFP